MKISEARTVDFEKSYLRNEGEREKVPYRKTQTQRRVRVRAAPREN